MTQILPDTFIVPTRAQEVANYKRDYQLRNPGAATTNLSLVDIDAQVMADVTAPIYYDAQLVGNAAALDNMTTAQIQAELVNLGTDFLPATGASGEVLCSCSSGGTYIQLGQELKNLATNYRYQCNATALYQNGQPIPVIGIDTGPATDIAASTPPVALQWVSPPIGCNQTATVIAQADGTGLSGGAAAETNAQAIARIRQLRGTPPASGNDAEYQALAQKTPGVTVQQAFTYSGILGPGTIGIVFTLIPSQPGGNRIPNAAQIAAVLGWLKGQMPGNDVILAGTIVASPLTPILKVTWAKGASGWADATPWPPYYGPGNNATVSAPTTGTTSPTYFCLNAPVLSQPQVGQSIGMLDTTPADGAVFRRKKVLSVAADANGGWDITVDTTTSLSDTSYTPVVGQIVCPWSDSLQSLVAPCQAYFDQFGPGEQIGSFFDPGTRQRRSPASPTTFPNVVSNRLLGVPPGTPTPAQQSGPAPVTLFTLPTLSDVLLVEPTVPYSTPTGTPGVSCYLIEMTNLAAYPE